MASEVVTILVMATTRAFQVLKGAVLPRNQVGFWAALAKAKAEVQVASAAVQAVAAASSASDLVVAVPSGLPTLALTEGEADP